MNTVRLINKEELNLVRELFSEDNNLVRQEINPEKLNSMITYWEECFDKNIMRISMMFDENNNPIAMYSGIMVPQVMGFMIGATKIKTAESNFFKSAKMLVPALEVLLTEMESLGYYKFWMAAPERHHNIRNSVMRKYSDMANRYIWYDECIIPKGEKSPIALYDVHRIVVHWSDVLIRMFVLKQEHRIEKLKEKNLEDYNGTNIDELV